VEALCIVIVLVLVGLAANRWGVSSQDDLRDPEWERRRSWRGFASLRR
jgi:hypothetical protein